MTNLEKKQEEYIKKNPDVRFDLYLKERLKDEEFKRLFEESRAQTRIAIELMRLRKKKRLTQSQLAKSVRMPQANIARIERGEHFPTLNTLSRIFNALGEVVSLKVGKRTICL
ncbi:transcriptional regulator [Candidatus Falkowbacteria bacterium CG10_big_fil_rev_8_21_14_0_10_43_10]|uniref:Transcriptional regulator n=1 Tax=Candidatus Falkowbacteria bacterium CG10_big_fil_rev_8_21_14_0_10_43_10 TaxID=1974567 RepID=A0A2H0V2N4_9BACT|nr:MAG: transcriptional regulator [Candidatus Falkowbacteria bacterium CG10_big_fil_rev_8_21_14_0_10_43_10]